MSGSPRPKRSAISPKTIAPPARIASVSGSARAIRGRASSSGEPGKKACARSSMTSVRMKKSNASSVQPRKPARTALRWLALSETAAGGMRAKAYQLRDAAPAALLEAEAGAEVHARSLAVERMRDVEIQIEQRQRQPQPAADTPIAVLIGESLAIGRGRARIHEEVEAGAA